MRGLAIGLAAALLGASGASASVLTFDRATACGASICGNFAPISQSYGDTALIDVSYSSLSAFGNSSVLQANAFFWKSNYGDLTDVVYGGDTDTSVLQIKFTALQGATLQLNGFQAAGWPNTSYNAEVRYYDLNYNQLGNELFVAPGTGHYQSICENCTITGGFILQLGPNGYHTGIDNLDVSAFAGAPEPASWALLIAGFGLIGVALRRRSVALA